MQLERFSIGMGDRFAHQGRAQLEAVVQAQADGIYVVPVWNKSFREHSIVHTEPASVRAEADAAVTALGWKNSYYVDADHINLGTVDGFIDASDFFTLDVADEIGKAAPDADVDAFAKKHADLVGAHEIAGLAQPLSLTADDLRAGARKYLLAGQQAAAIYRRVRDRKGEGTFVTEVSMDETNNPQTPGELLLILAMIADEQIPAQTVAPKFSGRFNKGVDYVGDVANFAREFEADVAVISYALSRFQLPKNLKLSVHSGSDKFSIYPAIRETLIKHGAGLHLKTAGTTWLEELIGLAESGGNGLEIAKTVYAKAHARFDELCKPYATVIDIDASKLPSPMTVNDWTSDEYTAALRHDQQNPAYNPHVRQLLHVGYKVAAELGTAYTDALNQHAAAVGRNVRDNLLERHIRRVFPKS